MTVERIRNAIAFATVLVVTPFAVIAIMAVITLFDRF